MRRDTRRLLGTYFYALFALPILSELAKPSKKESEKLKKPPIQTNEIDKDKMINALVEFSKANFDIHTKEAISYIAKKAEQYYNETFKQQEQ
jgi:hypothetical protein